MTQDIERDLARAFMQSAYRRDAEEVSPMTHVIGFWLFLTAAAVLLGAAVFLPIWQDHQRVLGARAETQERIASLRSELTQLEHVIDHLGRDPALNERAALRDLNFFLPGQEVVDTEPAEVLATRPVEPARSAPSGSRRSAVARLIEERVDLEGWAHLVNDGDVRRGMLIGAAFLISAAMVLFAPPSPRSARSSVLDPSELEHLAEMTSRRKRG